MTTPTPEEAREARQSMVQRHPQMRDAAMPLTERIDAALHRIDEGHSPRRIPVEATDIDIVLHDCKVEIRRLQAAPAQHAERQGEATEQQEAFDALLDGFDSRIETAKMNHDQYDVGYLAAMRDKFVQFFGAASPPPAQPPQNPWRDAIDEALVVAHLGVATEPYDDLNRLLEWHHDVWLDPAVSSDAQALIDRGAAEERQRTAQPAQAEFHNPWRTSLENCISGGNYLRAREYRDLIEELDELYRLRAAQPPREPVQPLSDTVSVCKTDANNYCRILTALGMEEEGDPVAEVERLITERMGAGGTK